MKSKISEIFLSYQGEGPFVGSRQLFVRFYGCNMECKYCDTFLESYKTFTEKSLLSKILDFEDDYNELVLTGGEPLLFADFLKGFLPLFGKHREHRVYLETNGTLPCEFEKIQDFVDIVAMDVKLPSSTGSEEPLWDRHERFISSVGGKELIIKSVVSDASDIEDIKQLASLIKKIDGDFSVVLQPVTPVNEDIKEADEEMLSFFKGYIKSETGKEAMVMGQMHKCLGIK